jgi:transposase
MPHDNLTKSLLLPELKLLKMEFKNKKAVYYCQKLPRIEYCPRCAEGSNSTYDHRLVTIKDTPIRNQGVMLLILKRRLFCKTCQRPFTEYLPGIQKGHRTTDRFERALLDACNRYSSLKQVREDFCCSSDFLYRSLYKELERECREKLNYEWPTELGIDEHSFKRDPYTGQTQFVTMIVDYSKKRLRELVLGKTGESLFQDLHQIPGRDNVKRVVIDMCDPYKKFIREFFTSADIVADKFHVLRLLGPAILKKRKEITGTRADARAKRLLLMNANKLDWQSEKALWEFLDRYPELNELYWTLQMLHKFYRIKGYKRAAARFTVITDDLALSELPEIKKLRKTLLKWVLVS